MSNKHEHIDRAINAADHKVKELYDQKQKRRHARALVAELLRGMDGSDLNAISPSMFYGFNAALAEIKHRAGLEGEG